MSIAPTSAEEGVFMAKLAEQAGRYEDMLEFVRPVIEKTEELTVDERCLVSVTFKSLSDEKRAAWHVVAGLEQDPKYESVKEAVGKYKRHIEEELKQVCKTAISAIDDSLMKRADTAESKVFFLKIKADYYRYVAEVCGAGPEFEDNATKALETYLTAKKIASDQSLDAINPVRLGLALNLSVFFYEIKKNPKEACQIAKSAFDEATSGLQVLEEDQYKDSTYIMQMIKDNLTSWTSDAAEPEDSPDKAEGSFA